MSDPSRCSAAVADFSGYRFNQCRRKGVVEQGGKLWCKQHNPDAVKARSEVRAEKRKASRCPHCHGTGMVTK